MCAPSCFKKQLVVKCDYHTYHDSPVDDNNLLLYRSANLPDKIELWAFLYFNLECIPFSPKIRIFFQSKFGFWGIFACISSVSDKDYFLITMITIINTNCDGSLPHVRLYIMSSKPIRGGLNHWYLGGGGEGEKKSLQFLDFQRLASLDYVLQQYKHSHCCSSLNNKYFLSVTSIYMLFSLLY